MLDRTEENPKLQAVVSLLTTGPVGVGDKIGFTDVDLVHRSVLVARNAFVRTSYHAMFACLSLSVHLSGTDVHCEHTVHLSADSSLRF